MSGPPGFTWHYRLLGGLAVEGADGRVPDLGGRKQRAVLAALLLDLDRAVPADQLIDRVWGHEAPPRAGASLQAYISKLRRQLEPGRPDRAGHAVLITEPGGYRLAVERDAVDLARFDDLRLAATAAAGRRRRGHRRRPLRRGPPPPRPAASRAGR